MSDKHSAPAFSIGGPHQKIKHSNETAPGPGAYESATFMQTIKYSTSRHEGQRSRFKGYDTLAPGPGTYSHQASKSQGPTALVMSRSRTIEPSSKLAPGPGSYNPDYKKMVKGEGGYTIGGSSRIGDIVGQAVKKPGPGDYETNRSSVTKDSGFKIGNQKRTDMVLNHFTPGPGQYQQKQLQEICSRRDGNTVFSKSGRSFSTANLIPGPGTYVVPDCFKDSRTKGFSIISKSNQVPAYSTKVPGPGAYNSLETDLIRQKGASFSMGKNPKMKMENQRQLLGGPGPQRYTIAQGAFESKSSLFGKASRPSPANQKGAPGPGSYTFRYQSTLPQFSIPKSSSTWLKNSSNPGPGTYESKIGQTNFNSFKIAKDEKRSTYDEKKGIPGPGSYQFSSPMQKSIGAKIGNEKRGGEKVSSNPGPGNYQISSTISNLPKYVH